MFFPPEILNPPSILRVKYDVRADILVQIKEF